MRYVHGQHNSPTYKSWQNMKNRCLNKRDKDYPKYGGRGIKLYERWHDFGNFLEDMGERPAGCKSLDRIDVNGNYEPENCRWATLQEQNFNKRTTRYLTHNGETKPIGKWAREYGICKSTIKSRIDILGWNESDAITTPSQRSKK